QRPEVDRHAPAVRLMGLALPGGENLRQLLRHRLPDPRDGEERLRPALAMELDEGAIVRLDGERGLRVGARLEGAVLHLEVRRQVAEVAGEFGVPHASFPSASPRGAPTRGLRYAGAGAAVGSCAASARKSSR